MTDRMQEAMAWLSEKRQAYASQAVTYRRGGTDTPVTATYGSSAMERSMQDGTVVDIRTRDFLVDVDDLPSEPQAGDLVLVPAGSSMHTYEVLTDRPFDYTDSYRRTYRIHTIESNGT